MNRTDRLLAIILELQGKRQQRAEDLAATFETSKRTIYRDIQALLEAGVPVVSVPGQGYSLLEGYFLPPLSFSTDEATMLLLGAGLMADSFDADYRAAAAWAGRKIEAVLPEALRERVAMLLKSILFVTPGTGNAAEQSVLQSLRRAILKGQSVRFVYHTRFGSDGHSESNTRQVDPYALVHVNGAWNLNAFDHLRASLRTFRLSRIEQLTILPQSFTRPVEMWDGFRQRMADSRTLKARLWFDEEAARWLAEDTFFFIDERIPERGGLSVTLRMRQEQEVIHWILGWGRHVHVLEPESLRRLIASEAAAMLRNMETP